MDRFQQFLSYFRFHPYAKWNDTLPENDLRPMRTRGPIVFTNAVGDSIFEIADANYYADDLSGLAGKIVFPDPTMGGIFPDLTNANFWPTVQSLRTVESRVNLGCGGPGFYDEFSKTWIEADKCRMPVLPSDLDILMDYLVSFIPL
ncbi:MAG: hypothetical protein M3Y08_05715 [Fibrobacterota bacterium]|nr:hypothetical protein [Fibrobacterota bacterium]